MRITIEYGGRSIRDPNYIKLLQEKYYIEGEQKLEYNYKQRIESALYYCPSCHIKFYSEWYYCEKVNYHLLKSVITYDTYGTKVRKWQEENFTDAKLDCFCTEEESYGNHIKKRYEEFEESGFTEKCPLCNSEYSYIDHDYSVWNHDYELEDTGDPNDIPGGLEAYKKYETKDHKYSLDPSDDDYFIYDNVFEFYNAVFLPNMEIEEAISNYIRNQEIVNQATIGFPNDNGDVSAFCEELESKYGLDTIALTDAPQDEITKGKLKNYVMNMIQLETDILSATEYLKNLMRQYHQAKRNMDDVGKLFKVYLEADTEHLEKEFDYKRALATITKLKQEGARDVPTGHCLPEVPQKPQAPRYKNPNIFNKKKIAVENEYLEWKYQAELELYQERMVNYNLDVAYLKEAAEEEYVLKLHEAVQASDTIRQELELLEKKANQAKIDFETAKEARLAEITTVPQMQFLSQKIEKAKKLLESLYKTRKEMYALNIVFEKYRDLVSLSTFYEYLSAGRCTTLSGVHGAYNLYEAEIRADRIIYQLSDVINSLDAIAKTQRTVYSQLRSISKTMDSLDKSMKNACKVLEEIRENAKNIEQNSNVIAFNTQETAYYAKINANLTNAVGFMVALK